MIHAYGRFLQQQKILLMLSIIIYYYKVIKKLGKKFYKIITIKKKLDNYILNM